MPIDTQALVADYILAPTGNQYQVLFTTDCTLPHKRCVDEIKALLLKKKVRQEWLGRKY